MDDSSVFIQWAMETLQHEHPPAAAAAYAVGGDAVPSPQELRCSALQNGRAPAEAAAQDGRRRPATDSWSSGESGRENTTGGAVVENDAWSSTCSVGSTAYPPSRKRSVKRAASAEARNTSPDPCVQAEHVMAERKRREKISRRFIELSTVIPGLEKMDKATILSAAVRYVKEQQEKLKELEDRAVRNSDSAVLAKRPDGATTTGSSLPEIEARVSEGNVMVRIHCEDGKGVLVSLLAQVEGLHLSITHTNVITFPDCTVNITIIAKVDEGFNIAAEDVIGELEAALHRRHS